MIDDKVAYRLPLSPFGEVAFPRIRWQLRGILAFRQQDVTNLLLPDSR